MKILKIVPNRWHFKKLNWPNLNFLKMVRDINTKFSPVVNLDKNLPCRKFEVSKMPKIWISRQKPLKLLMGVAGAFFKPWPPDLDRIHFLVSCKNAEVLVMISWVVKELAKISGSVPSISRDVLELPLLKTAFLISVQRCQTINKSEGDAAANR